MTHPQDAIDEDIMRCIHHFLLQGGKLRERIWACLNVVIGERGTGGGRGTSEKAATWSEGTREEGMGVPHALSRIELIPRRHVCSEKLWAPRRPFGALDV